MASLAAFLAMLLLWAIPASAQDKAALPLVAMLRVNSANTIEPMATMFRTALATHGHIDGRNIRLESRLAEGRIEQLPTLAQSLARDRASVIVTFGEAATRAAQEATKTIPIVALADDLVASGLIASMARPGGNITGVSIFATELDAKKLEILHSIVPSARRFAVLHDPATSVLARMEAIHSTAQVLGVTLHIADVRAPADIGPAFVAIQSSGAEAIDVLASPMFMGSRDEIGRLSKNHRLPAICQFREMAEAGCVASYGIILSDAVAVLAGMTDKALRGTPPGDIPAQQPSRFELIINQKAARAMNIIIPPAILARADEVIE